MDDQFREDLEAFFFNVRVVFGEAVGEVGGGVDAGLGGGEGASDVVVEVAGGGGGGGVGCSGEERFVHYLMCVCFCYIILQPVCQLLYNYFSFFLLLVTGSLLY